MPIPETLRVYGRDDLVVATSPDHHITANNRRVTRTVTLHYTHGWRYQGGGTVHYWLDLDGTLYQCNERDRNAPHVGGGLYFTGFVNSTSLSIEICRFGKFEAQADGNFAINGYAGIEFELDPDDPEWSDYVAGRRFHLWKIPGGTTYRHVTRHYYKVRAARFDDARNPEADYPHDILFTEEQYATLIPWLKASLEHYRLPKAFLRHPVTGVEDPWIDTVVLARADQPDTGIRNEAVERAKGHLGVWGHMNLQTSRVDPGASMDYYRLKRGLSDRWWYPVELDDTTRALSYLDATRSADYLALTDHGDLARLEDHYRHNEEGETGFFPLGANRVWHGGIHLPTGDRARQVYAMANGWVVAARLTNGTVRGAAPGYSRCFVLLKHLVHTQDAGDEVDYAAGSTRVVYSLYMHLEPLTLTRRDDGAGGERWAWDYATQPKWACHFLLDHPTDATVGDGGIIYPDKKVELGDHLGATGDYVVAVRDGRPVSGKVVHVEVFTAEDPSGFGANPWTAADTRVEDPGDALADRDTIDRFIRDAAGDGIDDVDVKNAAPGLRHQALRCRIAWSLDAKALLGAHAAAVSDDEWETSIRPLCFQADIAADAAAPADQLGPFHGTNVVWHLHPLTFLEWMNRRVDRHQQRLIEQDRPRGSIDATLTVRDGYVTGFQNLGGADPTRLPQRASGVRYPAAVHDDNGYDVTVDMLADQVALAAGPQSATRFSLALLEALEIANDEHAAHGVRVVEGYVSAGAPTCSDAGRHPAHLAGDAVDLRPNSPDRLGHWYELFDSARQARTYLRGARGKELEFVVIHDPPDPADPAAPTAEELAAQAAELQRRLEAATGAGDAGLTAAPAVQHLDRLRMHVGFAPAATPAADASLSGTRWLDATGRAATAALPGQTMRIEVHTAGLADGAVVACFVMSELMGKTLPPDLQDMARLRAIYGSPATFDLAQLERHETRPRTVDGFVQRLEKQLTGVDPAGRGHVTLDWAVPERLPHGTGSLYAVCIVAAGATRAAGGTTAEHVMADVGTAAVVRVPHIERTSWSTSASGSPRVTEASRRSHTSAWVVVRTVALPAGCELVVSVRDLRSGDAVSEERRTLSAGDATTIVSSPAPRRSRDHHATVRVTRAAGPPIDLTSGAGLSWTD